jgi:hypothetical protein
MLIIPSSWPTGWLSARITKQVTFAASSMGWSTVAGGDLVGRRNSDRVRGRNDDMPRNKGRDW